jgi:hypothetical protein
MKLKREKVLELNHILANTNFEMPLSARFRYTVTQNIKATKGEIDAVNEAFQPPEEINEYNTSRQAIISEAGISTDEEYAALEEDARKELDAKLFALDEENKDLLAEVTELEAERLEFLKEEVDIELKTIKVDDMPDIAEDNQYPHWQIWAVLEAIVVDD